MSNTTTQNEIDFTRINNDTNGNPRYVCHFLTFITKNDEFTSVEDRYILAQKRALKIGGRKFHNKQYGGGIVFQSYSLPELTKAIHELMIQYDPPKFLNEWNETQCAAIQDAIELHFRNKTLYTHKGKIQLSILDTFDRLDTLLGLAYTSSSSYAGFWICNITLYYGSDEKWQYNAFTIGADGKFYAVLQDKDENEKIILL